MTKESSFKRRVRERMSRPARATAARSHLVRRSGIGSRRPEGWRPPTDRPSEDKLVDATGKRWDAWFSILDRWGARGRSMPRRSPSSSTSTPSRGGGRRRSPSGTSALVGCGSSTSKPTASHLRVQDGDRPRRRPLRGVRELTDAAAVAHGRDDDAADVPAGPDRPLQLGGRPDSRARPRSRPRVREGDGRGRA